MATFIVYSGTSDGQVAASSTASYATARSGSGTLSSSSTANNFGVGQSFVSPNYQIWEAYVAFVNPVPAGATYSSVTFGFVVDSDVSTTNFTIVVQDRSWLPTVGTALWSTAATTSYGSVSTLGIATGSYTNIALSSAAWTLGTAQLMLISQNTLDNVAPTTPEEVFIRSADYTGTTSDPKLTYVASIPWSLKLNATDVVSLADVRDLRITDSGANTVGRLSARIESPTGTASVPTGATVTFTDDTATLYWKGSVLGRQYEPAYAKGATINLEAVDLSANLDRVIVSSTAILGVTDQSAVQSLVSTYGSAVGLAASTATVENTYDYMDVTIDGKTLREALQLVADGAISADPSGVEWTPRTNPITTNYGDGYKGVAYDSTNSVWVATTLGGTVIRSTDTFTWSTAATGVKAYGADWGNGVFVAGGGLGTYQLGYATANYVWWSTNGTAWSSATLGTVYPLDYQTTLQLNATTKTVLGFNFAWYKLDETSGTVAYGIGAGSNGTYVGSPTLGTAGALQDETSNKAVAFNGTSQYVSLGTASNVAIGTGTVEAWIKTSNAGTGFRGIVTKQYAYGLFLNANVLAGFDYNGGGAISAGLNLADGAWHHVAMSFQSGVSNGTIIYADGVAKATSTMTVSNQNTEAEIANGGPTSNQYFAGTIDEVAIYQGVLGSATILAHYQSGTATRHGAPNWYQGAYGTAGWVLVGNDDIRGWVAKSTTGTASWAITNEMAGTTLASVVYANGYYVAASDTAILYSTNGTAWSTATYTPSGSVWFRSLATNGTAVVAFSTGTAYYSATPNGTYTGYALPANYPAFGATYWGSAGLYVAVSGYDTGFTSSNGTAWTQQYLPSTDYLYRVAGGPTRAVAVGSNIVGSRVQDTRERTFYVDTGGTVHYGVTAGTAAPYAISDAPNGTTSIAAEELEVDYDESGIVNRVFVATADRDWVFGAWVEDATSKATYGPREAFLVEPNATDALNAAKYGKAYLVGRKDPEVRGRFVVTGKDGWAPGQVVTITNAGLGLSAASYTITEVVTEFLTGTGLRRYRVSFGGLPKSLVRAIASSE